jgi:hypothetical protein
MTGQDDTAERSPELHSVTPLRNSAELAASA